MGADGRGGLLPATAVAAIDNFVTFWKMNKWKALRDEGRRDWERASPSRVLDSP